MYLCICLGFVLCSPILFDRVQRSVTGVIELHVDGGTIIVSGVTTERPLEAADYITPTRVPRPVIPPNAPARANRKLIYEFMTVEKKADNVTSDPDVAFTLGPFWELEMPYGGQHEVHEILEFRSTFLYERNEWEKV